LECQAPLHEANATVFAVAGGDIEVAFVFVVVLDVAFVVSVVADFDCRYVCWVAFLGMFLLHATSCAHGDALHAFTICFTVVVAAVVAAVFVVIAFVVG
jgi:hypothetical protein